MQTDFKLYHYWRSSSSWRVRWALTYKGLTFDAIAVNLLDGSSESEEHLKRNPLGYVPVLQSQNKYLIESVAIIEWLEELYPAPALFPKDPFDRAKMRALVEIINSGTQPIQNLSVVDRHSKNEAERKSWMQHFTFNGLQAYNKLIQDEVGPWSMGQTMTAADLFLVPQMYNAQRQEVDTSAFKRLNQIYAHALQSPACAQTHPDKYQPKA